MTPTTTTDHPVRSCVQQVQALVAGVSGVQPVYMNTDDKASVLVELSRLEAQISELRMRVLAVSGDVADRDGARDISTWLAHHTQAEPRQTRAEFELAKSLEDRSPVVAAGMATGHVSTAHARVILDAVNRLRASTEVEPAIVEKAETQLVAWADQFRPSQLRTLGRRILEVTPSTTPHTTTPDNPTEPSDSTEERGTTDDSRCRSRGNSSRRAAEE